MLVRSAATEMRNGNAYHENLENWAGTPGAAVTEAVESSISRAFLLGIRQLDPKTEEN